MQATITTTGDVSTRVEQQQQQQPLPPSEDTMNALVDFIRSHLEVVSHSRPEKLSKLLQYIAERMGDLDTVLSDIDRPPTDKIVDSLLDATYHMEENASRVRRPVVEYRHRVHVKDFHTAWLTSKGNWFRDWCVGIHTIKIVAARDYKGNPAKLKSATLFSLTGKKLCTLLIDDPVGTELIQRLAGANCNQAADAVLLPLACNYDPDRFWLPVAGTRHGHCYKLHVESDEPLAFVEVEFTCMLDRRVPQPFSLAAGGQFLLPTVERQVFKVKKTAGTYTDVEIPAQWWQRHGWVGMAIVPDHSCVGIHQVQLVVTMTERNGLPSFPFTWKTDEMYPRHNRKFSMGAELCHTYGLLVFGPHMAQPTGAIAFDSKCVLVGTSPKLRIHFSTTNSPDTKLIKFDLYRIGHTTCHTADNV